EVNGTLRIASLEHAWINEKWRLGEGKTVVEISNILVKVSSPQVSEFDLSIDRIKGEIGLKGGMGGLEDISATGTDFDLVGSGTLLLRPRFSESLLDFNSRLTLKTPKGPLAYLSLLASPGGSLDLSIRGPLQRPTPYINGQPLPAPGIAFGNIRSEGEKEGLTGKGIKVAGVISS
ncbi:MAG TPA: type II secretion system protein GspN, partial [Nitrospiria bacterium]|nr:type II secretion system protein GspN [Nitrospiria bacterium]